MNNPEKPETKGTQDEDKQNKNITQYVLDTTIRKPLVSFHKNENRNTLRKNVGQLRLAK
jgi:hypothetical protein